jgi:hypothetical protein
MPRDLRKLAKGMECQIRIPGVCNGNAETSVLAHLRMAGITGTGQKAPDPLGAWSCSDCHTIVDSNGGKVFDRDYVRLCLFEGIARTQAELIKRGILKW